MLSVEIRAGLSRDRCGNRQAGNLRENLVAHANRVRFRSSFVLCLARLWGVSENNTSTTRGQYLAERETLEGVQRAVSLVNPKKYCPALWGHISAQPCPILVIFRRTFIYRHTAVRQTRIWRHCTSACLQIASSKIENIVEKGEISPFFPPIAS